MARRMDEGADGLRLGDGTLVRLFVVLSVCLLAASATAQSVDLDRGARNYFRVMTQEIELEDLNPQELREVLAFYGVLKSRGSDAGPAFEVVYALKGCKYFVMEQGANYSLAEEWSCLRPSKGDTGYGKLDGYGSQEVTLNGSTCTLFVDDWLLSKSRATEKLLEKCS